MNSSGTSVLSKTGQPFEVEIVAEAAFATTNLDGPQRVDAACFFDSHALRAWAQAFLPDRGWRGPLTVLCAREREMSLEGSQRSRRSRSPAFGLRPSQGI